MSYVASSVRDVYFITFFQVVIMITLETNWPFNFFYMNSILILSIFFLYITMRKHNTVFIFMREVSAGDWLLYYSCKYGPTELLQGWESADGHLIGRWQVRQALEGAWQRQVIWLRLRCQDAAYPIVFWRHIHTCKDTEKGRERKVGRLSFNIKEKKENPRSLQNTTC